MGGPKIIKAWHFLKGVSQQFYSEIYERLNVEIEEVGESFYQSIIPDVLEELDHNELLDDFTKTSGKEGKASAKNVIENKGKLKCINLDKYDIPLTVVKSDGSYTYDTTDLAAIKYRLVDLNADLVLYVVDNGQALHFNMLFDVAKQMNWIKDHQQVKHVGFGLVLGEDKKKFRSRNGDTVKLIDLLDEALQHATKVLEEIDKEREEKGQKIKYDADYKNKIIENIGHGSLKYADLSATRTNDYVFSFSKMLSLKGNTGVYQLYNYVRICSILEKANDYIDVALNQVDNFKIATIEEINICKVLLQLPEILEKLSNDLMFHNLCTYLYNVTTVFSNFFIKCRCIGYDDDKVTIKNVDLNRLLICMATKNVLHKCLHILGIEPLEHM